jgi:predicted N-formylglutamate amidohydrolase
MVSETARETSLLLGSDDVPSVFEHNSAGRSPFLLTSDHFGRALPSRLGNLGLPERELVRHIAWDIGIAGVATALSDRLDAHLIAQNYSRLVIDCNRPPHVAGSIPRTSETTAIPGNEGLADDAIEARRREVFDSYHRRIRNAIDRRQRDGSPTVLVALHSFTPLYKGIARPWHVAALYRNGGPLPPLLLQALRAEGDLVVGDNEPYSVGEETDYTIPVHGEARGLINTGIEIRQDLIGDATGQRQWAERLARILLGIEATLRGERLI